MLLHSLIRPLGWLAFEAKNGREPTFFAERGGSKRPHDTRLGYPSLGWCANFISVPGTVTRRPRAAHFSADFDSPVTGCRAMISAGLTSTRLCASPPRSAMATVADCRRRRTL